MIAVTFDTLRNSCWELWQINRTGGAFCSASAKRVVTSTTGWYRFYGVAERR
jgi:hypothetical protein